MKNVKAQLFSSKLCSEINLSYGPYTEAPFFTSGTSVIPNRGVAWEVNQGWNRNANLHIDLSLSHPTGPESSPRTMSYDD